MENGSSQELKWYDKTWLVVVLCIVFFPVGLYALWKNSSIGKGWKIAVTALIALIVIANLGKEEKQTVENDKITPNASETPLTQAQKDSVAKSEKLAAIEERKKTTISANAIVAAYEANEVNADEVFKGKSFYVEGYINSVGKDILDDIYVSLESGNGFRSVQCFVDDKDKVKNLQKGTKITIYGKCEGLMMNVLMKNCTLVDNLSDLEKSK